MPDVFQGLHLCCPVEVCVNNYIIDSFLLLVFYTSSIHFFPNNLNDEIDQKHFNFRRFFVILKSSSKSDQNSKFDG